MGRDLAYFLDLEILFIFGSLDDEIFERLESLFLDDGEQFVFDDYLENGVESKFLVHCEQFPLCQGHFDFGEVFEDVVEVVFFFLVDVGGRLCRARFDLTEEKLGWVGDLGLRSGLLCLILYAAKRVALGDKNSSHNDSAVGFPRVIQQFAR